MSSLRLHIILFALALGLLVLFARAVQVQVLQKDRWDAEVEKRHLDIERLETTRGRIMDVKGREMAINAACIDAVVDYRVIIRPADEEWVGKYARARLVRTMGSPFENAPLAQRKQWLSEQIIQVRADIEQMWHDLGNPQITGCTPDQIEERRQQTVRKVQMLRRYKWYGDYVAAGKEQEKDVPEWWQRWLLDDQGSDLEIDSFDVTIKEQTLPHVILPAVSGELANYLGKNMDRYPGLSLQAGEHRVYPMKDVAPHLLGYVGPAGRDDLEKDPSRGLPLRKYLPNGIVGRSGVESMCEQLLRGTRGRLKRQLDTGTVVESIPAEPGADVTLTIDAVLQQKIEHTFATRTMLNGKVDPDPLYGAAIVIDVPTNEVRALVSYPTYDVNELDKTYAAMVKDDLNHPLLNRATQAQREPGSTVKPMVGISGITEHVVGLHERIECTGKLILDGKAISQFGKCWTYRLAMSEGLPEDAGHHRIPTGDPHPTGFLEFQDALERSCNVWCETVADRLGGRVSDWYDRFGLGRPTGIGLPEVSGRIPRSGLGPLIRQRRTVCVAGIGQGDVLATPIQMANVAATIARGGLWMRPKIVGGGFVPPDVMGPDQVRLPVDPAAVRIAQEGMRLVVNSPAGSGYKVRLPDIMVAGKTGSAQAARMRVTVRDEKGNPVIEDGKEKKQWLEYSNAPENRNALAPWYRGAGKNSDEAGHAWFIGFAPFDHPRIAFAVMVEYGGSGGSAAGPIVKPLLEACREEGYLPPPTVKP